MSHPTEKPTLAAPSSDQRKHLLELFQAPPGEKPLTPEQFNAVRPYLDFKKGGINHAAFDLLRDDKDLIQAAQKHRAGHTQEVKEYQAEAKQHRDLLLKALNAGPGEKNLTLPEFKQAADFLDRKNGGLRREVYQAFKEDTEILEAAKTHRESWQARTYKSTARGAQPARAPTQSKSPAKASSQAPSQPAPKSKLRRRLEKRGASAGVATDRSQEAEPEM